MPNNLPQGCTQKDIDDAMQSPNDPVCPNCGSDNVERMSFVFPPFLTCMDCDHQWGHE